MAFISRDEFLKYVKESNKEDTERPQTGNADWKIIYELLRETEVPLTVKQIFEHYVKGVVTRFRTLTKLHQWTAAGKCIRIWSDGRQGRPAQYVFFFGDLPEGFELPEGKTYNPD